jgi:hypothetical protein
MDDDFTQRVGDADESPAAAHLVCHVHVWVMSTENISVHVWNLYLKQ